MASFIEYGKGVRCAVEGDDLVIRVSLKGDHGISSSGKSLVIATTQGNKQVANVGNKPVILGLNAYTPVK